MSSALAGPTMGLEGRPAASGGTSTAGTGTCAGCADFFVVGYMFRCRCDDGKMIVEGEGTDGRLRRKSRRFVGCIVIFTQVVEGDVDVHPRELDGQSYT